MWENKTNDKIYVGGSTNLTRRYYAYIGLRNNIVIINALKKYGLDNFIFHIIEYTEKEKVFEREQY